jgi:hypothetical protein
MRARIYKPAKTAMQSGRAKTEEWVLEPELLTPRTPDPLMGWISAGDTFTELRDRLRFKTAEEAAAFAKKQGWDYTVVLPHRRKVTPRNYLDNFKWTKPGNDTDAR